MALRAAAFGHPQVYIFEEYFRRTCCYAQFNANIEWDPGKKRRRHTTTNLKMSKPTIIIVPGAWQTPPAFEHIVKLLQEAGYPTVHVPLPTVGGTELPLAGLSDDVDAVRKALVPIVEQGKDVVVIGHSAGGISMSGAVEGFDAGSRKAAGRSGGVIRCIFMTAFVLPKGQSLLGMLGGQPLPWMVVEVSSGERALPKSAAEETANANMNQG